MDNFKYKIIKEYGVVEDNKTFTKEINLISYNGNKPQLDFRVFKKDKNGNKVIAKGITFNIDGIDKIKKIITSINHSSKQKGE